MEIFDDELVRGARAGGTWWQLYAKRQLQESPAEEGFAQYCKLMAYPASARLERRRIGSLLEFARNSSEVYHLIEPPGEPFELHPPRVIGAGNHRTIKGTTRSLYLAALDGVTLRGRSQFVQHGKAMLLDIEDDEFERVDDDVDLDPAVFAHRGREADIIKGESQHPALDIDEAFSLLGPNSIAFGHWIAEYLPRLAAALASGMMPAVPVLIDARLPRQHREATALLASNGVEIIEVEPQQRVKVGRLWFAPTYYYAPILALMNERYREETVAAPPERFAPIARFMAARFAAAAQPQGTERVYLARKARGHRQLVNGAEIEAFAAGFGFKSYYFEDLSFAEQIAIIRGATHVMGPEGSAHFLSFFARPGTKIAMLNHQHTELLTGVTALLDALDLETTVITGPMVRRDTDYVQHSDYRIDEAVLRDFVQDWTRT